MTEEARDPFRTPELSARGGRALSVVAAIVAVVALFQLSIVLGPIAMALGLLAHLKGDRWGFKAAILAGVTTVLGMALEMFATGLG